MSTEYAGPPFDVFSRAAQRRQRGAQVPFGRRRRHLVARNAREMLQQARHLRAPATNDHRTLTAGVAARLLLDLSSRSSSAGVGEGFPAHVEGGGVLGAEAFDESLGLGHVDAVAAGVVVVGDVPAADVPGAAGRRTGRRPSLRGWCRCRGTR